MSDWRTEDEEKEGGREGGGVGWGGVCEETSCMDLGITIKPEAIPEVNL